MVILLYLYLILLTAKRFNFFVYLNNLEFTQRLSKKIASIEGLKKISSNVQNNVKPMLYKFNDSIFVPLVNKTGIVLESISSRLTMGERKTAIFVSSNLNEAFSFTSLLARKAINSDVNGIWSISFVIIVLIYFILTNL
jgi:hypothetical protein